MKHNNNIKSYSKFNYMFNSYRQNFNDVKSYKNNYFDDGFNRSHTNYYYRVQKHYKILKIDLVRNSNKINNYFFEVRRVL